MKHLMFLALMVTAYPAFAQDAAPTETDVPAAIEEVVDEAIETVEDAVEDITPAENYVGHGLAMHGDMKYAADFTHFDYVNPDAPKGGTLRMWGNETFDTLNPYIPKGVSADGLALTYETLMTKAQDEPFTMYGALAETVETPADRSAVTFTLRENATWHDGEPVQADDVVYSFELLTTKGNPFYRAYYHNVTNVEALDDRRVKFTFDQGGNLELPLIVGDLPILPKHYWEREENNFEETTLTPPPGSGPYKIGKIDAGRSIEYVRVKDWWGENLPVNKGRYNFDRITYDYYRDQNVSLEALFANEYDFRQEYTAKLWATSYDAPPVVDGRIKKELIENALPQGMQAFAFNLRRPMFQDEALRKAINYAFDFEWSNKQFAFDAYVRTDSYFENSEMESAGLPEGRELEILEAFRDQLPPAVFTEEFKIPKSDGSGNNRGNLRIAKQLLDEAGYKTNAEGTLVSPITNEPVVFELLVANTNASFERWFQPWKQAMERLGIKPSLRIVDASQYINRVMEFDYDMIVTTWGQSTSPGNEQREYWGSDKADAPGSRNFIGLKDPVVDALIDLIVKAPTREELVIRTRALDRVLKNGWYVVPNWHIAAWRIAYWDKFGHPETQAPYALGVMDTWWVK